MKKILLSVLFLMITISISSAQTLTYNLDKNNISATYDENGRLLTQTGRSINIQYYYDAQMNDTLTNISNPDVTVKYQYDDKKRVTKETKEIDGITFEKEMTYDSMDRMKDILILNNVAYIYSENGKIARIENVANVTYNANLQVENRTYPNGLVSDWNYNPHNLRVIKIQTNESQNLNYDYDLAGNIESLYDSVNGKLFSMTYDNLNRLISTKINRGEMNFEYNSIGNIISVSGDDKNKSYTYTSMAHAPTSIISEISELFSFKNSTGSKVAQFSADGNLTLKGECSVSANCVAPSNSLIFIDSNNETTAYIDEDGNLCIESGSCSDGQTSCEPINDSFVFQNDLRELNLGYISFSNGEICITGDLRENEQI